MEENDLAKKIVDICYHIHVNLGSGLFESVYEEILAYEFSKIGVQYSRQQVIPVHWDHLRLGQGFKADIIVEESVIIEIKSVERIMPVHKKQLLTYLKLSGLKLGLLINFNEALIKDGITRIVNGL